MRPSLSHKLNGDSSLEKKKKLGANHLTNLWAHEPIPDAAVNGFLKGGSCKKAPLNAVHSAADANE